MIRQLLSNLLLRHPAAGLGRKGAIGKAHIFDKIVGFNGIKRTFLRSLNSKKPVHILLIGPPGQAKTLFLKSILEKLGGEEDILYPRR
jgi:hypothetical protein